MAGLFLRRTGRVLFLGGIVFLPGANHLCHFFLLRNFTWSGKSKKRREAGDSDGMSPLMCSQMSAIYSFRPGIYFTSMKSFAVKSTRISYYCSTRISGSVSNSDRWSIKLFTRMFSSCGFHSLSTLQLHGLGSSNHFHTVKESDCVSLLTEQLSSGNDPWVIVMVLEWVR